MRILLIGKTGQLGADLIRNAGGHHVDAPDRAALDICSRRSIADALSGGAYDCVINTAAFHQVPQCEVDPETAFRVNCVAVRDLAVECSRSGTLLVTFSTDYVFGGERRAPYIEDDRPSPVQMYGITRLAGEQAALAMSPEHAIIVRTCGLYGASGARSKGGNFVDARVRDGASGSPLQMGSDQTVSPTSSDDLSKAVLRLLEHPARRPGIYHLVNEGACTWFEFTRAIFETMRFATVVTPVDRGGRTGEMRRPLYSALANTKAAALGIVLPHWRDALARYLVARHGAAPVR